MPATADRTPVILHCLFDALSEREGYDPSFLRPAIDRVASAALWPPTGIDEAAARWLADLLAGDARPGDRTGVDARIVQARAAARFAEVACALSLHADDESAAATARDLWRAASRLLGHDEPAASTSQADDLTRLHADAWRSLVRVMADDEDPMRVTDTFSARATCQTILGRTALDERDVIAGWLRRGGHGRLAELLDDGVHRPVPGPHESVAAPTPTDLYGRVAERKNPMLAARRRAREVYDGLRAGKRYGLDTDGNVVELSADSYDARLVDVMADAMRLRGDLAAAHEKFDTVLQVANHDIAELRRERDEARYEAKRLAAENATLKKQAMTTEPTDAPMSKATLIADLDAARELAERLAVENATLKDQLERVTAEAARRVEEAQRKSKHGDPVRVEVVKTGKSTKAYQIGMRGVVVVSTPTHWTVDLDNGVRVRGLKSCFKVL